MKINAKQPLKNFAGEDLIASDTGDLMTVGKSLAGILVAPTKQSGLSLVKRFILAQDFFTKDEVELDKADFSEIKKLIEQNDSQSVLIIGQILSILDEYGEK